MRLRFMGVLRDEGKGEGGLVGEVVVESTDGGLGLLGDGGHGDGLVADGTEELFSGLEEAGATNLGAVLLRFTPRICKSRGHPRILWEKES